MKRYRVNLPVGCWVVLMLPVILVAAPFVLTFVAVHERLQRCPNCKRRGTLERVHLALPPDISGLWHQGESAASGENWQDTQWEDLRRINPDSVAWECRVCGSRFKQDTALPRLSPPPTSSEPPQSPPA